MFVVFETVDNAGGFDDVVLATVATEAEAQAIVEQYEAEEVAEFGEVIGYYSYYNEAE